MRVAGNRRVQCLVVAMLATACGQSGTAQTTPPSKPSTASPVPVQGTRATVSGPITIEFDVPAEFLTQAAGGADAITGFRVGYFWAGESNAIRTVDVARDAVTLRERTARVTLSADTIPACGDECAIRIQTLTRGQSSPWSAAVPLDPRAAAARLAQSQPIRQPRPQTARPERAAGAPPARTRQQGSLTADDLRSYASLSETLRTLLPPDANIDAEVRRFRRLEELALAVVISRDHGIPLTTLGRTLEGPPRLAPRDAVMKLRSDLRAGDVIRKARAEAARLTDTGPAR